jgi:hypothetical protein
MTRPTPSRRLVAAASLAAVCLLPACSSLGGAAEDPAEVAATGAPAASDVSVPDAAVPDAPVSGEPASTTGEPDAAADDAEPTDGPVADEEDEPVAADPPQPEAADVVVSNAYWDPAEAALFASGQVSPVIEDGGTCTLEVSRDGSDPVRATSQGIADATTTVCDGLALPGDELRPGTWSVVLRYESDTASGESAAFEVEVPE